MDANGYTYEGWAADAQARYAAHRRAWNEAVGRREIEIPLAEPCPLTVDEPE